MVFSYFAVPAEYQRRVLLYGILGALVMRAIMIPAGRVAGNAVQLGVVPFVRSRCHRRENVDFCRSRAGSGKEPDPALVARPSTYHQGVYEGERFSPFAMAYVTPLFWC